MHKERQKSNFLFDSALLLLVFYGFYYRDEYQCPRYYERKNKHAVNARTCCYDIEAKCCPAEG